MLRDLLPQKRDALAELIDSIDAILNADPTGKADARECGEDGVVVVHAAADDAVSQPFGIANAVLFLAEVFDCAFSKVPIAGVHGDDSLLHPGEQNQRIFAGENRIARIVVDAEMRRVNAIDELAKDVGLLREFGNCQ